MNLLSVLIIYLGVEATHQVNARLSIIKLPLSVI